MASQFNILPNTTKCAADIPPAELHPRPPWLKVRFFGGENYQDLKRIMRSLDLHTVCESARCPNQGECWEHRTATFMILGDICTRACGFCAVTSGRPAGPPDEDEPQRVAQAVEQMNLKYVVVTSVNRDDQPDGGAKIFARTIEAVKARMPECKVEVLIPDFRGDSAALQTVVAAGPDVLNHNVETVLVARGTSILTLGQYLQPTREHLPVVRFVHPQEFAEYKQLGRNMGFRHVEAGPLVRSSYHAFEQEQASHQKV